MRVQPGAKHDEVVGQHGEELRIRLRARAVDGKANDALIRFLAQRLGVSRSAVRLTRGTRNRSKVVEVDAPCDPASLVP